MLEKNQIVQNPNQKLQYVQVLRGLAALMVVFFHTSLNNVVYFNLSVLFSTIYNYGWLGVQFFFVLSGFIITYIHLQDVETGKNIKRFLKKRFTRIYPIYWVIATIMLIYYVFIKKDIAGTTVKIQNINDFVYLIRCYLLLPTDALRHNFIDIAWTLTYEILFYCVFAICIKLRFKKAVYVYFFWAFLILLKQYTSVVDFFPFSNFVFNILIFYFLMGCFVAYLLKKRKIIISTAQFTVALIALLSAVYGYAYFTGNTPTQTQVAIIYNYLFIFIFSLLLLWAAGYEQTKTVSAPPLLVLLGDASYSIYLTHTLVIMFLYKISKTLFTKYSIHVTILGNNILFLVIVASCIIVGVIVHRFVEKPILLILNKKKSPQLGKPQN